MTKGRTLQFLLREALLPLSLGALGGAAVGAVPIDWSNPIAAIITVGGAGLLGNAFGLADHVRRQERDEVSRRYVDEGFDRAGRTLAECYQNAFSNLDIIRMAVTAVALDMPQECARMMASLKTEEPSPGYEAYRISTQLPPNHLLSVAMMSAYADLRNAHSFCCRQATVVLADVLERRRKMEAGESAGEEVLSNEERALQMLKRVSDAHSTKLQILRHQICVALSRVSSVFQSAGISTVAEAMALASNDSIRVVLGETEDQLRVPVERRAQFEIR